MDNPDLRRAGEAAEGSGAGSVLNAPGRSNANLPASRGRVRGPQLWVQVVWSTANRASAANPFL